MQIDASGADALASAARRFPASARVVAGGQPGAGTAAYEVESSRGTDVRRDIARTVVGPRLGPARAAADADEPRRDLPAGHDRRSAGGGAEVNSVRNVLAIADKELRSYFASPIAYVIIGLFALLFGWFFYVYLTIFVQRSEQMVQMGGGGGRERQPGDDPLRAAERRGDHPLPDADDHDADLLRGETVGHDRAAAHVAGDRRPDHPRQVLRRDGALRGRCCS